MAESKLLSLTEIFNEKLFRIPDFQRGYSWQKPQLDDFWADLVNLKEEKNHYTGLLTIEPVQQKQIEKITETLKMLNKIKRKEDLNPFIELLDFRVRVLKDLIKFY